MLYDSTKSLLRSILQRLEGPGLAEWDDQIEAGNQCLYEMHQMTRPSYKAYKTSSSDKWPTHVPDAEKLHRAMPHVKAMVRAIRHSDRPTAVESGKAALAEMNGISHAAPPVRPAAAPAPTKPPTVVAQHPEPAPKRRAAAAGRPPAARRCRAVSTT